MKQIFALWHDYSEWTFFANSLEEAKEYGIKICNERGWKYHGVTARNPYRPCCPHPTLSQLESNCPMKGTPMKDPCDCKYQCGDDEGLYSGTAMPCKNFVLPEELEKRRAIVRSLWEEIAERNKDNATIKPINRFA